MFLSQDNPYAMRIAFILLNFFSLISGRAQEKGIIRGGHHGEVTEHNRVPRN